MFKKTYIFKVFEGEIERFLEELYISNATYTYEMEPYEGGEICNYYKVTAKMYRSDFRSMQNGYLNAKSQYEVSLIS